MFREFQNKVSLFLGRYTYRQRFIFFALIFFLCVPPSAVVAFRMLNFYIKDAQVQSIGLKYQKALGLLYNLLLQEELMLLNYKEDMAGSRSDFRNLNDNIADAFQNLNAMEDKEIGKIAIDYGNGFKLNKSWDFDLDSWKNLWNDQTLQSLQKADASIKSQMQKTGFNLIYFGSTQLIARLAASPIVLYLPELQMNVKDLVFLKTKIQQEKKTGNQDLIDYYALLQNFKNNLSTINQKLTAAKQTFHSYHPENENKLDEWDGKQYAFNDSVEDFLKKAEGLTIFPEELDKAGLDLLNVVFQLEVFVLDIIQNLVDERRQTNILLVKLLAFSLIFSIAMIITFIVRRTLTSHINKLTLHIQDMSKGNFISTFCSEDNDEFGLIGKALNKVGHRLQDVVLELNDLSSRLQETSTHAMDVTDEQDTTFAEHKELVDSINGSISSILTNQKQLVSQTLEYNAQMRHAFSVDRVKVSLEQLQSKLGALVEASSQIINSLSQVEHKVGGMNRLIAFMNKVSEGANLLSLSASIETANLTKDRESFAAISEKIQRFASNTSTSTKDIRTIMDLMLKNVASVKAQAVECLKEINAGAEQLLHVSFQLSRITRQSKDQIEVFENFSHIIQEQLLNTEKMSSSLEILVGGAQHSIQVVSSMHQSISELDTLAKELRKFLELFKCRTISKKGHHEK